MGLIITIGREFGSGGREFARCLATELGIEYYDREIVAEIAKRTEMSEQYVKQVVEKKPHGLFPINTGSNIGYNAVQAFQPLQSVFKEQSEIIKDMASKSDCVIVGRCADYILEPLNPHRIFIYSDMDSKIKRCMEREQAEEKLTEKQMHHHILQTDRNRSSYYSFFTGKKWGDRENYDLCINTTNADIASLAKTVAKMFK